MAPIFTAPYLLYAADIGNMESSRQPGFHNAPFDRRNRKLDMGHPWTNPEYRIRAAVEQLVLRAIASNVLPFAGIPSQGGLAAALGLQLAGLGGQVP
jgi:hypothetical protein